MAEICLLAWDLGVTNILFWFKKKKKAHIQHWLCNSATICIVRLLVKGPVSVEICLSYLEITLVNICLVEACGERGLFIQQSYTEVFLLSFPIALGSHFLLNVESAFDMVKYGPEGAISWSCWAFQVTSGYSQSYDVEACSACALSGHDWF